MGAAPSWKVYSPIGEYVASCKYAEDAAAIVAAWGDGANIRWGHTLKIYIEGEHEFTAGDSYDAVAQYCISIVPEKIIEHRRRKR